MLYMSSIKENDVTSKSAGAVTANGKKIDETTELKAQLKQVQATKKELNAQIKQCDKECKNLEKQLKKSTPKKSALKKKPNKTKIVNKKKKNKSFF